MLKPVLDSHPGLMYETRWAVRNSGLMLLNSLLRRLNGGTDTNSTKASSARRQLSLVPYEKYPNLSELVLRLLSSSRMRPGIGDSTDQLSSNLVTFAVQKIFPALEVVERFGMPKDRRREIGELLRYHMEGSVWSIRDKAAKALACVMPENEVVKEIESMLGISTSSQNELHGRLLCIRYMLARLEPPISGHFEGDNHSKVTLVRRTN